MIPNKKDKRIVAQTKCPTCPSSDAFTVYEEAGKQSGHCFSCGYNVQHLDSGTIDSPTKESLDEDSISQVDVDDVEEAVAVTRSSKKGSNTKPNLMIDVVEGMKFPIPLEGIPRRKINFQTCNHFGVRVGVSPKDGVSPLFSLFPRYRKGSLVGWKTIDNHKNIVSTGGNNVDPFGINTIKPKGKKLWITEGEYDAMSVYQALRSGSNIDWEPDVISIPNGCASAVVSLSAHYDKLIKYDEIILVFDNDDPGIAARLEVCKMFAGKVSYVEIPSPYKDANDMLMDNKANELKWLCLSNYQKYQPDGIINAKDLKEEYFSDVPDVYYPFPNTMPVLNQKLYGAWPGSIITLTSGSGCGKTQTMKELMYHYYNTTDQNIAGIFLEEDKMETLEGLIALEVNKRISLPDVKVSRQVEEEAYDKLYSSGRITLYDHFGGVDDANLLGKLRYLAITGHSIIFLDHLSIIVSEFASEGGERERIDTLMTQLAKFVKEFNVILFLVVHLKKSGDSTRSFEEGARPSLDDLRGSASIKQLSWTVLGLTRNQQHYDDYCKNIIEVTVLKSRKTGRTGVADYLHFNEDSGRLYNIQKPDNWVITKKKKGDSDDE